ncbi:hypothetical protein D3C72_1313840 [compost metagenome]
MLIAHISPPTLERGLAEKAVLFRIQIVMFDVGIHMVIADVPGSPVIRIDAQRQSHQPPGQTIDPRRAGEGVVRSIVIDVDVEQHAHHDKSEVTQHKGQSLVLH